MAQQRRKMLTYTAAITLLLMVAGWMQFVNRATQPEQIITVAPGVTYQSIRPDLTLSQAHVVTVDLDHPDLRLVMRGATRASDEYVLEHVWHWASRESMLVAVNANMFIAGKHFDWGLPRIYPVGGGARTSQPIIAEGTITGTGAFNTLVWFDEYNRPHVMDVPRRAPREQIQVPGNGFTTWGLVIEDGLHTNSYLLTNPPVAPRTTMGWDADRGLLWIFAFESADEQTVIQTMLGMGVRHGVALDGGGSTCMVVRGTSARSGLGTLVGGHRPVASMFGITTK